MRPTTEWSPRAGRVDTPDWVRDAVFHQIFPDGYARSRRMVAAGPFEAWDAPPSHTGLKGRDRYGMAEHLDDIAQLGVTAIYLNPVFSAASNHRYNTSDYARPDRQVRVGLPRFRRTRGRTPQLIGEVARIGPEQRTRSSMSQTLKWSPEGGQVDTPAWVRDATFYQILPDRFARSGRVPAPGDLQAWNAPPTWHGFKGGDLYGIAEHLGDLSDLGVTAISLNPVFASGSNHRYHTFDYFRVDPMLGGDSALRELIDACHDRGMRIVLDGVFNHVGRGFFPFHHLLENGIESPYRDWFYLDPEVRAGNGTLRAYPGDSGNPEGALGYGAWWGLAALPKLNVGNPQVREMLWRVGEHWIEFGADGWRIDVGEEIDDGPFWAEFRRRCRAVNPETYIVGEIWHEADRWLAGDRYDAVMNYQLAKDILGFTAGRRIARAEIDGSQEYRHVQPMNAAQFADKLLQLVRRYDPAVVAAQFNLIGSHDTPRFRTMAGGGVDSLRLATLLQATLPGAPCIYYGDELGLEGGSDPACRAGYPTWRTAEMEELRSFVRALLQLRAREASLRAGNLEILAAEGGALAFRRGLGSASSVVVCNAGDEEATIEVGLTGSSPLSFQAIPGWEGAASIVASGADRCWIAVAPRSGAITLEGHAESGQPQAK